MNVKAKNIIIITALLLCFFLQSATSMFFKSATWDETHYFGLGKYLLTHWQWDVPGSIFHPPLSFYIHSIPLLFFPTDETVWHYDTDKKTELLFLGSPDLNRGRTLLSSPLNKNDTLLNLCRLMIVIVSLLLGYWIYMWSYNLYGPVAACLALFFFAFSPNLIAHSRLITPDMILSVFFFGALYYFWTYLANGNQRHLILGGIALGLALLSKLTALFLLPVTIFIYFISCKSKTARFSCIFWFILLGAAVFLIGYGFNIKPYLQGLTCQLNAAAEGHSVFLMGLHSKQGWWYYYIVAFLIKTPLPVVLLLVISSAMLFRSFRNKDSNQLRNESVLIIPAVIVFSVFSLFSRPIGLRYILPMYPFLFVFISKVTLSKNRLIRTGLLLLVVWQMISAYRIYPHYLAYFNELVGGPDNGYRYLVDSNLDWGQDLKGLKTYLGKKGIPRIAFSYFGSDDPSRYGIEYDWLPSLYLPNPRPEKKFYMPSSGYLAISATNLQEVYLPKGMFAWLKQYEPVAKIGYSIFVYDLNRPPDP